MRIIALSVLLLTLTGCSSTSALDEKFQAMRRDLQSELKREVDRVNSDYKRDLQTTQQSLQNEINSKHELAMNGIEVLKQLHHKDTKEINTTLIDVQKDFFQNRRVTEENSRRVYILESLIAATRSGSDEKVEGEILRVQENQITTSLGSRSGIKAGDKLAVYKDTVAREQLGTIQIIVAESTQSTGEVLEKSSLFLRGYVVRPQK